MKALILALALTATACGFDDETLAAESYAQMVCAYEATGQGWPNYKDLAIDCEARRGIDESKTNF